MRSPLRRAFLPSLLLCVAGAANVDGHGGVYPGPSGTVPPTGRVPSDPTPPPPDPTTPRPAAPGRPATPRPDVTSGPRPTTRGTPRGWTPRGRPGGRRAEGFERWEFWWEQNKEPFLDLKRRLRSRDLASGSSDFYLGGGDRDNARVGARATDRQIREKLIPGLVEASGDRFFDVRAAAVIGLGKTRDLAALPAIVRLLADEHKQVRESAALALGLLGDKEAVPTLLALMNDTPEGRRLASGGLLTRTRAFAALGLGFVRGESVVEPLLAQVRADESQKDVPICAALALGVLGDVARPALPGLLEIAADRRRDEFLRAHAASAVARIGGASVAPALHELLKDDSPHVARSAVVGLGVLAREDDAKSVALLSDLVAKGRDLQAKNWALVSLGKIGGKAARKTILETLEREQSSTQAFAALGLAILGREAGDASDGKFLHEKLVAAKDASVKSAMAIAVGILEYKPARDDLEGIVSGGGAPDLRGYAAVALGLLGSSPSAPRIRDVLRENSDPDLRRSAATALGLLGDSEAVPILVEIMRTAGSEYVISSAALALGFIGEGTAVPDLLRFIRDPKTADLARANATSALGVIGDARDIPGRAEVSVDLNYRALVDALQEFITIV